ncbi:tetratricopeptide repeat protein [Streptomyces sp. NPDC000878]
MSSGESGEPPAFKGTALCVVCEVYDDSGTFPQLVGAKAQMAGIAGRLKELGYEVRVVGGGDPDRGAFDREVREWSEGWREAGARKPALILWSGHGVLVDEQLRLVLRDLVPGNHSAARKREIRNRGVSVEELVDHAVSSDADQILVLVDACYSGDGAGQSVQTALDHWAEVSLPPGRTKWLGFMASCQRNEKSASDGPLFRALAEVLRKGPRTDEYLSAWSTRNELITGVEVLAALPTRWEEDSQRPVRVAAGDESRAFPNPLAVPGAPPVLVEHLVLAARGVGHREEGWFFTGRRRVLGQIVEWMETGQPGLFLVTGPAGCGKSAVLGRIATLADAVQRAEAVRQGALREGDPDPGERDSRSFAAVHLRGLNATQAAAELAGRLGLREPRNADAFRAELRELEALPVIVLDGLDEVPAEHTQGMIEELVFPLSRMVPVLVGSRERSFRGQLADGETLPTALARHVGTGASAVDLGNEPDTREDIAGYVKRRFDAADVAGEAVAGAVAGRATAEGGGFLFARLVTGFLIAEIRDRGAGEAIDGDDLVARLPDSVEAAFEEDLRSGPTRVRDDGAELPSAARDLLTALAWAAGRGMPAGGVWEAVASALGGCGEGTGYDESDVDWVLSSYGRYVVEDSEGSQAVYRLYHREFVSYLRGREGPEGTAAGEVVLGTIVGLLRQQAVVGDWGAVDPYVREWLATHALWAEAPGPGIDVLRELVVWDRGSALPHLAEALHDSAVALSKSGNRAAALELSQEAAETYRSLTDGGSSVHLPGLASALSTLAVALAGTGDREGALAPTHEAVRIRRALAEANPAAHLPGLANSLNNLANHLAEAGDREGALEPAHEAVLYYTQLAQTSPAAHLPDLANSLNTLATRLAGTGDRQGALEPVQQAVRIRRALAEANPATHLPSLASSLNTLANRLADTGDHLGALEPAHETVRIRRALAQANPAAYLPDLASSLNNLANHLSGAGDREGALEPAREAVRHCTQLAQANPAAHLPDLARTLNNLAVSLAETGNREGALEATHEAVRIRRALAQASPAAHLPNLANSLNTLAVWLADTGDRQGALEAVQEAVRYFARLAQTSPATYLPNLANSLNTLAIQLAETGNSQAALAPAHEAVRIRRTLAQTSPAAHLPDLARALNNLAIRLADTGDHESALAPAHEAVRHYTQLTQANPAAHLPDLANSLNTLAVRLAGTGDHEGALKAVQEAVRIRRTLAQANPTAHLPDFANSLDNLAVRLADTGDHESALAPAHEAVRHYTQLTQADPTTHLPDLAHTLNNLAIRLADTGDHESALAPAHEAVRHYTQLTQADPTTHLHKLVISLNNLADRLAATDNASVALQCYTEAAADLAEEHPAAQRAIECQRESFILRRSGRTPEAALRGLIRLLVVEPTEHPDHTSLRIRTTLRSFAHRTPHNRNLLEQVWHQETGTPAPPWLSLSRETLEVVEAWMATRTWAESQEFWSAHIDVLASEDASTALAEFTLVTSVADQHRAVLSSIRSKGAAGVYKDLILRDRLTAWINTKRWDDSKRVLQENSELFLDESAEQTLMATDPLTSDAALHAAILCIARNHGIDTAFKCVEDRSTLQQHVLKAIHEGNADALWYAAAIELTVFNDEPSYETHTRAARLLSGTPEAVNALAPDELTAAAAAADPETRNRLVSELATLSALHGQQHSTHWLRLIQALTQPRPS